MRHAYLLSGLFYLLLPLHVWAETPSLSEKLESAAEKLADKTYTLRYKFKKGEVVRWRVVHLATTETRIKNGKQVSQSRSVSTKKWRVTSVDDDGNITFEHIVQDVDMRQKLVQWKKDDNDVWKQQGPPNETGYNSKKDKKPPLIYEHVADTIDVPLATVTVAPNGTVLRRDRTNRLSLGLGNITIPFPEQPMKVGFNWHALRQTAVRLPDKTVKQIKLRHRYTLKAVKGNIAQIGVFTEVLTPIHDQRVKAQLIQKMVKGTVHFDIEAGRLASQQMDWDETIVNFTGPDSLMQYVARFTEELVESEKAQSGPTAKSKASNTDDVPRTAAKP